MSNKPYLTAEEATAELGVSRATLYAYVSRGLVRSQAGDTRRRTHVYSAEDVDRLKSRQEQRADPSKAIRESLNWGAPIIDSAITKIADGRLFYRGHDAVGLADTRSVEEVAALIWTGDLGGTEAIFAEPGPALSDQFWFVRERLAALQAYDTALTLLPVAAVDDDTAFDFRPLPVARTGRRILQALVAGMTGARQMSGAVASTLAGAIRGDAEKATPLFNAALVLCADHELSASSFTARCVASAGASPYAAVEAGLCALRGNKHGGMSARVEAFLSECEQSEDVRAQVVGRQQRGEGVPGFGMPLYPEGDPRAAKLLSMLRSAYPTSPRLALCSRVIDEVGSVLGDRPSIDFALVALSRVLGLPRGSAMCLLALGRTVGWIGHIVEEYQTGRLIRPRARYVGE